MGASKRKPRQDEEMLRVCAGVQTAGGRVQVRWEFGSAATPVGQAAYFIEFLTLAGWPACAWWVGAEVRGGNEHSHSHRLPGLLKILGDRLRLSGWERERRVVVLRRPLKGEMLLAEEADCQGVLGFVEADRKAGKRVTGYETAVLVTPLEHEILALGPLYRDRADAENAFDELKNPWGWGGFTTHDPQRCQLSARAVVLIHNGWRLFVRLAPPDARREAITSRPWLMSSIGRKTEQAGQTTISLTKLRSSGGDHSSGIASATI